MREIQFPSDEEYLKGVSKITMLLKKKIFRNVNEN